MSLKVELGGSGELAAEALGDVLALDVELLAIRDADDGVGEVDGNLWLWVLAHVVVVLEAVQVQGIGDGVVTGSIAAGKDVAGLALKRPLEQWLGRLVVLVGEGDALDGAWCGAWVHEDISLALLEAVPLKVWRNTLDIAQHVRVRVLVALNLAADVLNERRHSLLDDLNNVVLKRSKVLLDTDQVVAVVVLLQDLLVETVVDASLRDIWIIVRVNLAPRRLRSSALLAQKLNVLLSRVARLLDLFGRLSNA